MRGCVAQQSVSCKVFTELMRGDPPLPWSPTWPEPQVERMGNQGSGLALIPADSSAPGRKRRSPGLHFAFIHGSKQGLGYQILSRESPVWLMHKHTHLPGQLTSLPY